ncbi:hypothetical protein [Hymenobacter wooponensis]|uniref:O-antigen polysaccharide polymerase Wzy n=1 Tax=Hymenobacter wooponensis TaxID=1525360 RepID=A0A4Z0MSW6_9BACT|nr:hypothetical protein [Hymenobacter wooponensis]TGD82225.1 hypothetical protein EU557_00060 [Hymenobacter wooponensis]
MKQPALSAHATIPRVVSGAKRDFLSQFVFWSWVVIGLAAVLQGVFFGTAANLVGVGAVLLAWAAVTLTALSPGSLQRFPLSSYLIVGFTATQFVFPLLFTLLEGKELVYNLKLPYTVFLHSLLALGVLILTHVLYRFFSTSRRGTRTSRPSLLERLGLFKAPTDLQIWLIGFIGLGAMFFSYFYMPSQGRETTGALEKIIEALVPFTYAPYFIPFGRMYGQTTLPARNLMPRLAGFTVLLFVLSLGTNSRGAFMLGFTSVGFTFALGLLLGMIKTRLFTFKNLAIALFVAWFLTGPLSDIGTAMVMVRNMRSDTPRSELIGLTWQAFQDKQAIHDFKTSNEVSSAWEAWDETYLDNIFLARFCNIKFNDINLLLGAEIGDNDPDVRQYSIDRFLTTLPKPVLDLLALDVDKDAVNAIAYGDFLYYKVTGSDEVFGARLTGHFAGTGLAAFGWWYLAILGAAMIPVYILFDTLFTRRTVLASPSGARSHSNLVFSFCGLLSLTMVFQFLPTESVTGTANFLLRGWIQQVLLYLMLYYLTRRLSTLVSLLTSSGPLRRQPLVSRYEH